MFCELGQTLRSAVTDNDVSDLILRTSKHADSELRHSQADGRFAEGFLLLPCWVDKKNKVFGVGEITDDLVKGAD